MDARKVLTQRFTDAINKSFNRVPLIGERWFKWREQAAGPSLQFTGARMLAKATCTTASEIVRRIMRHLDLSDFNAEVQTKSNGDILVKLPKPRKTD